MNEQSNLYLINNLNFSDWIIFSIVLLMTYFSVLYGYHLKKKQVHIEHPNHNMLDHLLMGRKLTLPFFIATLVATWYGGIFGVTQIAFESGIYNFITQGVFWYLTYILFAFFFVKKIRHFKAVTLPDMVTQMFGPKAGKISAIFNILNVIPVAYTMSLGIFLESLFGLNFTYSVIIGTLIVLSYSLKGGFRAVVFSDLIQFLVMCLTVLLVFFFSFFKYGGFSFLKLNLPPSHFHPLGNHGLFKTLVWGLIALSTLVDPNFYQRCFAAKNDITAKKGILISTLIWFCFDICTTAGGMYARVVLPNAPSNQAYFIYILEILPHGLKGLACAGILATILSTIDSYIFIGGSTFAYDLLPKKYRNIMGIHYLGIILTSIIAILLSLHFEGNIRKVWKTLGSYSSACLLFPIVFGHLFPKKISDNQFIFACFLGMIFTTYWRNSNYSQTIDELYIGVLGSCMGLIFGFAIHKLKRMFPK